MCAPAAETPENSAVHVKRAEKARFESANRRSRWAAVIASINEEVTPAVPVQVANADVAAESVIVLGNQKRLGN
jgi:hypothetical protein